MAGRWSGNLWGVFSRDHGHCENVTPDEAAQITAHLQRIEVMVRETNGRVRDIELWRARLQGVAATSRILWMVAGGTITAIIIAMVTRGTA